MTIDVKEWYDGNGRLNLTIYWDENDPVESQFNNWTPQDFLTALINACDQERSTQNSSNLHLKNTSQDI